MIASEKEFLPPFYWQILIVEPVFRLSDDGGTTISGFLNGKTEITTYILRKIDKMIDKLIDR